MKWSDTPPTRPGKYKMKDAKREYIIYVEKNGNSLVFREKGQTLIYTFNGTTGCQWKKCK